ncbi:tetratricopeptide repeat protein [Romeria aff. gracilis LEGE 07310]|uniref:Tetratricopeptide repeat protein n=1 Tax=Vasconcelosia minhoensis LEGE 07310 TaxID=915328 RepID=A0A8J7AYE5_9CYAN|nr:tetratricopeptide repeat protein [Romeria gracilis]MBE9080073.1 tetratricopeptide repeat protein [Romeria aff. gracilis LEGE 07310]
MVQPSEFKSLDERYLDLIEGIVQQTLKGNIRSKQQVRSRLIDAVERGTGEIFERCLASQIDAIQPELETSLKAPRMLRALQTIQTQWQQWQQSQQASQAVAAAAEKLQTAALEARLLAFLQVVDPNQPAGGEPLSREQLKQLAQRLQDAAAADLKSLGQGIQAGLESFGRLEGDLMGWLYRPAGSAVGFGALQDGPWERWRQQVQSALPRQLFAALAQQQPVTEVAIAASQIEAGGWVELLVLLQLIQQSLVNWFDRQPYDIRAGKQLSYSTFLIFAAVWSQLFQGFQSIRPSLSEASFQAMLQTLRGFAQRDDFPLYGGVFASFSGSYLKETLDYFTDPLKQVEGTQEKARLLTLLGYSQRNLGRLDRAEQFHQGALQTARAAGDAACEIANLCHLARTAALAADYPLAIDLSQRALIAARQRGDRLGEANALVNLGYSQVLSGQASERIDEALYGGAIAYLEQGLELAGKQSDRQSQALAYSSLGLGYSISGQPGRAIAILEQGLPTLQASGNIYLQGLHALYLAEANHALSQFAAVVYYSHLSLYLLESMGAKEWRQAAGLAMVLQGQLGEATFQQHLQSQRSQLVKQIGIEGYDALPELLAQYRAD